MSTRLGYCLNVHPGESLAEVLAALRGPVARARKLTGEPTIGVGLYLAAAAAREVGESEEKLDLLRAALDEAGARPFTANAFPFGSFHGETVKRAVYRPTWSEPARLAYTCDVAHALAGLLGEGESGSISTSPVSFKAFAAPEPAFEAAGRQLGEAAGYLEHLARTRRRELALAIEPEPLATFEVARELVGFLEEHVFSGEGRDAIARALSLDASAAEAVARRRVGACLDACHHAVVFEEIEDALALYAARGVRVVKAQLSSALEVSRPGENAAGVARLRSFAEPRYLHQTFWKRGESVASAEDIPGIFPGERLLPDVALASSVRSHFHVPLAWEGDEELGTTRRLLERALPAIARATTDLEVETYTWSVLPEATRRAFGDDVAAMIAAELAWVRRALGATPGSSSI